MNHLRYFTAMRTSVIAFCLVALTGCELQPDIAALQSAVEVLTQNKSVAEQLVTALKTSLPPEDPRYRASRELYEKARTSTNGYVGQVAAAALADDTSVTMTVPAEAAHADQTAFVTEAAHILDPNKDQRAIPFGLIVSALPPLVHKWIVESRTRSRTDLVKRFSARAHWKAWDEL